MPIRPLHRRLAAEPASVPALRTAVTDYAERCGIQGRRLHDVRLAVSEAVTNAVVHAYTGSGDVGDVALTACVDGGRLVVRITDEGRGMTARPDSPGAGVGLPLIATIADDVRVETPGDSAGTSVTISFRLPL